MVYDCFTFFNELDVLEIRLHELDSVVDKFVIVESHKTFTNLDKPLFYAENQDRFARFSDKIIHVVAENIEGEGIHWEREEHQRNQIVRGLSGANPEDAILIGDVDEIPSAKAVSENLASEHLVAFELYHTYGFLDLFFGMWQNGTRLTKRRNIETPQKTRLGGGKMIHRAGWHFAYLGDPEHVAQKLRSFSHVEFDRPPFNDPDHIAREMARGRTMMGDLQGTRLSHELLPDFVRSNQEKLNHRFCPHDLKAAGEDEMKHVT